MKSYRLPFYVAIVFGVIAPFFMGYVAYDVGRNSQYHQSLADALATDGIKTTARISEKGACLGSGRQPLDCWFSYAFNADQRTIQRTQVRIRYTENQSYRIGQSIAVIYSAKMPERSTHRTVEAHREFAKSNLWASILSVMFVVATFYIATRQLIGTRLTHGLSAAVLAVYGAFMAGLFGVQ
jgi:hypothetical protein